MENSAYDSQRTSVTFFTALGVMPFSWFFFASSEASRIRLEFAGVSFGLGGASGVVGSRGRVRGVRQTLEGRGCSLGRSV